MVLPPIGSVQVQMNKPAVRVQIAHGEHGVIGKSIGHIKTALVHVVRSGAQLDMVKNLDRRNTTAVTIEEGITQLGITVFGPEIDAEVLLVEVGERATVIPAPRVLLETFLPIGVDQFK